LSTALARETIPFVDVVTPDDRAARLVRFERRTALPMLVLALLSRP